MNAPRAIQTMLLGLLWLGLALTPSLSHGQEMPVAGDAGHVWVLRADPGRGFVVLHRGPTDPADRLAPVDTLQGQVVPGGLAAVGDELWLIYADGTVQRLRAERSPLEPGWTFTAEFETPVPGVTGVPGVTDTAEPSDAAEAEGQDTAVAEDEDAAIDDGGVEVEAARPRVRAMAASAAGPWVLAWLPTEALPPEPERLRMTDPDATTRAMRNLALGLPPNYVWPNRREPADAEPAAETPADPDAPAEPAADEPPTDELQPDGAPSDGPVRDAAPLPQPPAAPEPPAIPDDAPTPPADADPILSTLPAPRDHLLVLSGGRWRPVALPDDWPEGVEARLVVTNGSDRPTLVAREVAGDRTALRVYSPEGESDWSVADYTLPGAGDLDVVAVQGQPVIVQEEPVDAGVAAGLWVLGGGEATRAGTLRMDAPTDAPWGAAPLGLTVALVVELAPPAPRAEPQTLADALFPAPPALSLAWARIDLTGTLVQPPTELEAYAPDPWSRAVDYAVLGVIAALTLAMVLVLWRRDPATNQPKLPADTLIADLGRRGLAGLIDLLPVVFVVMRVYDLGFQELLLYHRPGGAAETLEAILPGAWVIAGFVVHTTIAELFFGRSIGKALTGLRVADMTGARPRPWQIIVRGVLKTIDLLAPLLLILPVIGPFRQRLGDVLARTLVVMPRPEDEEPESSDNDDDVEQ